MVLLRSSTEVTDISSWECYQLCLASGPTLGFHPYTCQERFSWHTTSLPALLPKVHKTNNPLWLILYHWQLWRAHSETASFHNILIHNTGYPSDSRRFSYGVAAKLIFADHPRRLRWVVFCDTTSAPSILPTHCGSIEIANYYTAFPPRSFATSNAFLWLCSADYGFPTKQF